jgi:hypothetical protein
MGHDISVLLRTLVAAPAHDDAPSVFGEAAATHALDKAIAAASVSGKAVAVLSLSIARLGIGCSKDTWRPDDPHGLFVSREVFSCPGEV